MSESGDKIDINSLLVSLKGTGAEIGSCVVSHPLTQKLCHGELGRFDVSTGAYPVPELR